MTNMAPLEQAKRPRTVMAGPYGHPIHPMIVVVPIGAWLSSFIFDLVAIFGDDDAVFLRGAEWLIGIGIVGALVAAIFGLIDLMGIPNRTVAKKTGLTHMTINLIVVVLFVVGFIIRAMSGYDDINVWAFIITIVALLLLSVSGWLGGRLAYHYGVRVADEATQAEGFRVDS